MTHISSDITAVFHSGEARVQAQAGVPAAVAKFAQKAIRGFMPDQHRTFYAQLPMLIIGALDDQGCPWASGVFGEPGFAHSPHEQTLDIAGMPVLSAALNLQLGTGNKIGLLGIEPETRRRNRMNGFIAASAKDSFTVQVDQSFGNCPQYIQRRALKQKTNTSAPLLHQAKQLGTKERHCITVADTFFIASRTQKISTDPASGVDVSHRGGRKGFVTVTDAGTLSFPDFAGNRFFNTLGNIEDDGRVGLFFPNFETGDALLLTGTAKIAWDGPRVTAFAGAERMIDVQPQHIIYAENALPLKGAFIDAWPNLKNTGVW